MNGMKTEEMGSRKKYLAPVVVLLLCLVSLTGAAYAYNSTMDYAGNNVVADDLSVDLTGGVANSTTVKPGDSAVVFTDHYKYTGENHATKTDRVECAVSDVLIWTFSVTISGDAPVNKLKVSSSDIATFYGKFFNGVDGTTLANKLAITVAIAEASADAPTSGTKLVDNSSVVSATAAAGDYKVYVFVDGVSADSFDVRAESAVAASNDHNAAWFTETFKGFSFDLTFLATYEA